MKSYLGITALIVGLASLGGFTYLTATGTIVGSPTQSFVPEDVRARPGSYRTFHFWHVGYGGYRGGK